MLWFHHGNVFSLLQHGNYIALLVQVLRNKFEAENCLFVYHWWYFFDTLKELQYICLLHFYLLTINYNYNLLTVYSSKKVLYFN